MNPIIKEDIEKIIESDIEWIRFANKTILITGANGFLPAYMIETLLYANKLFNLNIKLVALIRNITKAQERFKDYLENKHLFFLHQDICSPINLIEKVDFIVHAASQASPKYYAIDPVGTLKANTIGLYNLLEFSQNHEIESFLYFSSSEVYGNIDKDKIGEFDFGYLDCNTIRACYAESKRMGETMCKSWFHQYGIRIKIVRPFHTYGPKMDLNDGRVFADFVKNVINGENIVINSDGSAKRSFCYLGDATIAFFKILLNGEDGEAYNMGNPNAEISIWGLANMLADIYTKKNIVAIKKTKPTSDDYIPSLVSKNLPDITKLKNLGWIPITTLENGFIRTIKSYSQDNQ